VLVGDTLLGQSEQASGQLSALDVRIGEVRGFGPRREATNTAVVKAGNLLFLLNDNAGPPDFGRAVFASAGHV
jgi:hypothetical protein